MKNSGSPDGKMVKAKLEGKSGSPDGKKLFELEGKSGTPDGKLSTFQLEGK